jgi:hypothetical protein
VEGSTFLDATAVNRQTEAVVEGKAERSAEFIVCHGAPPRIAFLFLFHYSESALLLQGKNKMRPILLKSRARPGIMKEHDWDDRRNSGMEYVMAACIAVVFVVVLVLIRDVKKFRVSLRAVEEELSDSNLESCKDSVLPASAVKDEIPQEIIAAISAAVYCAYPGARVGSIRRTAPKPHSAWRMAGLLENTRPF